MLKSEIFISYAWDDANQQGESREEIVDEICNSFQGKGYTIIRDKDALDYGGSIGEFMQRIGRGKYVILVISDKYLRSRFCMFEVQQLMKNDDYYDRIFPVVLKDAKIHDGERIRYFKHWDKEIKKLQSKLEHSQPQYTASIRNELDKMCDIRRVIDEFIAAITDRNNLTPYLHRSDKFNELISSIESKIQAEKVQYEEPVIIAKTYEALRRLNYSKQQRFFNNHIALQKKNVGAFLLCGGNGNEQKWLLNLLLSSTEFNITNEPTRISMKSACFGTDYQGLIKYLYYQEVNEIPSDNFNATIEELQKNILDKLQYGSVVINIADSNMFLINEEELNLFMTSFWLPLCHKIQEQDLENKLLLFLTDDTAAKFESSYIIRKQQYDEDQTDHKVFKLLMLDPIDKITKEELQNWVEDYAVNLQACFRERLDDNYWNIWYQECNEGNPFTLIQRICIYNNTPFQTYQNKWMKY